MLINRLQIRPALNTHLSLQFFPHLFFNPLKSEEMELQADLILPLSSSLNLGISVEQHQNKENFPPFVAVRSSTSFPVLNFIKRQPLQDISHLFAPNANAQSIYNRRIMSSLADMRGLLDQTSDGGSRKRKATNLSQDGNINSSNLKRPLLRRSFR